VQTDDRFAQLSADGRGEMLKRIVNDDALLAELAGAFRAQKLAGFLTKLLG